MTDRMPEYRVNLARELRQRQTQSEAFLWEQLRAGRLGGFKFRRQRPLGRYIADFCCDAAGLVVEVDGGIHDSPAQQEYDAVRDATLAAHGYTILRLRVDEVLHSLPKALEQIHQALNLTPALPNPLPSEERTGEGEGGEPGEGATPAG